MSQLAEMTVCPICSEAGDFDLADGWNRCDLCTEKAAIAEQGIYDQLVAIRERIETLKLQDNMDLTYGSLVRICEDLSL
jgi:hypothetical protein